MSKEEPIRKKISKKPIYTIDDIIPPNPIELFFNRLLSQPDSTVPETGTPTLTTVPETGTPPTSTVPETGTPIYGLLLNPECIPDLIIFAYYFLESFSHTALSLLSYLLCKQRQTILSFSYRQLTKELGYSKTTITSTMLTFKKSEYFVVTIPPGANVCLDILNFVKAFKVNMKVDPILGTVPEIDTPCSSSSSSLLLNKKTTTTTKKDGVPEIGTVDNKFLKKIRFLEHDNNIFILAGVAKIFGLKETDLSKNICELIFKDVEEGRVEESLRNIVYAINNVKSQNRAGFFYLSLKNNYGLSLTKEYTDKISERMGFIKKLREEGTEGPALSELRRYAVELGIYQSADGVTRKELEEGIHNSMQEIDRIYKTIKSYLN